jgi:hypothetical protein
MKAVFADTSFFVAILNDRDSLHAVAREATARETVAAPHWPTSLASGTLRLLTADL